MVVTLEPATCTARVVHDFTARPSMCTTQAPHCEVSQPTCVPVRPSVSRRSETSSVRSSTSAVTALPFTVRLTVVMLSSRSIRRGQNIRCPRRLLPFPAPPKERPSIESAARALVWPVRSGSGGNHRSSEPSDPIVQPHSQSRSPPPPRRHRPDISLVSDSASDSAGIRRGMPPVPGDWPLSSAVAGTRQRHNSMGQPADDNADDQRRQRPHPGRNAHADGNRCRSCGRRRTRR